MTESEFLANLEAYRAASELEDRHGWNAHNYAAKLAEVAFADGETREIEFWKRVEVTLKPRISS